MKYCCFVIPYFGKLPNYFQLFLNSCRTNVDYNWLIITDDDSDFVYPPNVEVIYTNYNKFVERIDNQMGFKTALERPYKLCDFKPAYGFIFEEELRGFEYWGHCDLDIILGDLSQFINEDLCQGYDKIFCLGHMIVYRNTPENNRVFMSEYNGQPYYQKCFSSPQIGVFDELPYKKDVCKIDSLFIQNGKKINPIDISLNCRVFGTYFSRVHYNSIINDYDYEERRKSLVVWNDGQLDRFFIEDAELKKESYPYIHLQRRAMKMDKDVEKLSLFKIIPNAFMKLEYDQVNKETFRNIQLILWDSQLLKKRLVELLIDILSIVYLTLHFRPFYKFQAIQIKPLKLEKFKECVKFIKKM